MTHTGAGLALLALAIVVAGIWRWQAVRRRERDYAFATDADKAAPPSGDSSIGVTSAARAFPSADPDAAADLAPRSVFLRLYSLAFEGMPVDDHSVATRAGHADVVAGATALLSRIDTLPKYTPRRPQLLPQLMQSVNDDESSLRAIADLLTRDPALAGNLLRIANSALYRGSAAPVESIDRAVAMVGTEGLRSLIAAALMQPVMDTGSGAFGRFPAIIWEHTLASSTAATLYAKDIERCDSFAAQLLGLLQGLGAIIVVRVVRDEYARRPDLVPDASVAAALLTTWAGATARHIGESWGLSERIGGALHEQLLDVPAAQLSPLGRSLLFGRVAGALALLCQQKRVSEADALGALDALSGRAHAAAHVWKRLRA